METKTKPKTRIAFEQGRYFRTWTLLDGDKELSRIMIDHDGMVQWVGTKPGHRRKGYARQLWDHLVASGIDPKHSAQRYPDGDKWAHAVGGYVPPLDTDSFY